MSANFYDFAKLLIKTFRIALIYNDMQRMNTNNQNTPFQIKQNLDDLLKDAEPKLYSSLIDKQLIKISFEQPETESSDMDAANMLYSSHNQEEFDSLKAIQEPSFILSSEIKARLDRIWNGSNNWNGKHYKLFDRIFYNQKRCIKSLKEKTNLEYLTLPQSYPDWHAFSIPNPCGQSIHIEYNQQELQSIKKGMVGFQMIFNYFSILRAVNHVPLSSYVFPLNFLQKLLGQAYNVPSANEQPLYLHIQNIFNQLQSELNVKVLDYQYLIFPAIVDSFYKMVIVQGVGKQLKLYKTDIILCNFRSQIGQTFSKAIRKYLILHRNQNEDKYGIVNINTKQFHTAYLMLPREFNQVESGIYMMLYLEFLFAKKNAELQRLKLVQNHKKLHLFPRSLAFSSRIHIWNLFVLLEQETNDSRKMEICLDFIDKRSRFCQSAVAELDYDKIDIPELEKFMILHNVKPNRNEQDLQHQYQLNYYLDPQLNYELSQSFN